ncbi:hypothetical protein VNO77_01225 [Canavalia gladiata]|uniref:Uncharacterized protein n=1 Tax=Canavalia gladiata TaxID=3824 RepID=A0AAN9MW40_CANGL
MVLKTLFVQIPAFVTSIGNANGKIMLLELAWSINKLDEFDSEQSSWVPPGLKHQTFGRHNNRGPPIVLVASQHLFDNDGMIHAVTININNMKTRFHVVLIVLWWLEVSVWLSLCEVMVPTSSSLLELNSTMTIAPTSSIPQGSYIPLDQGTRLWSTQVLEILTIPPLNGSTTRHRAATSCCEEVYNSFQARWQSWRPTNSFQVTNQNWGKMEWERKTRVEGVRQRVNLNFKISFNL